MVFTFALEAHLEINNVIHFKMYFWEQNQVQDKAFQSSSVNISVEKAPVPDLAGTGSAEETL